MNLVFRRRSLDLTDAEWNNLTLIAQATGSIAPTGPNAGHAAWRTLIKRIADGDLKVVRRQAQPTIAQEQE